MTATCPQEATGATQTGAERETMRTLTSRSIKPQKRSWTSQDDQALIDAWTRRGGLNAAAFDRDIALKMGRTELAIRMRREYLVLITRSRVGEHSWTPEQDALVAAGHPDGDQAIAEMLGRSRKAIATRRSWLRRHGVALSDRRGVARRPAGPRKIVAKVEAAPASAPVGGLPAEWFGPPGSDTEPGSVWVPGAAYRRSA